MSGENEQQPGSVVPPNGYVYALPWLVLALAAGVNWHHQIVYPDASFGLAISAGVTTILFVYLESAYRGYLPKPWRTVIK